MTCKEALKHKNFSEKLLAEFALNENNFDEIPPFIGFLLADLYGNAIMTFEYNNKKFGTIKSHLSEDNNNLLEIDLVSMYFSSFSTFASNTNIQNLNHLEIHGSNIKILLYFLFKKFMVIIFLNSNTLLSSKLEEIILEYFKDLIQIYQDDLINFNCEEAKKNIKILKNKGKSWLIKLNNHYIYNFKNGILMKFHYIDNFMEKIDPIIKNELNEYLEGAPESIVDDMAREIKNKMQDKVHDLIIDLFKK